MTPPHTTAPATGAARIAGPRTHVTREVLERAAAGIAPLWPLHRFVAVNPYLGLTGRTFDDAAQHLARTSGARPTLGPDFHLQMLEHGRVRREDLAAALAAVEGATACDVDELLAAVVDAADAERATVVTVADVATDVTGTDWQRLAPERVAAWAAAYFDEGQAIWRTADRGLAPFAAWREEASVDRTPRVLGLRGFRAFVQDLPEDHLEAAAVALATLDVPADGTEVYLDRVLRRLAGWAAHAAWLGWEAGLREEDDDTLVQLLAVLLCWEAGLLATAGVDVEAAWQHARATLPGAAATSSPAVAHELVLQHAFDRAEQRRLVTTLSGGEGTTVRTGRPDAQAVFCIDVRSEVLRRHLEDVADDVDTLGFAGFFGMPVTHVPLAHEHGTAQCPALLAPTHTVVETLADPTAAAQAVATRRLRHHVRRAWKSFKLGAVTCFSFVGPVGLVYLPKLLGDGFGWTRPVAHPDTEGLATAAAADRRVSLDVVVQDGGTAVGIPLADRVELAEGALRGMSLADGLAPLVLLVGHGATTVNNPYDTGLHCGACGGHTGAANARVAAAVCNDPAVRAALAERGVVVPDDTLFVPALHDTTTDDVTVLTDDLPGSHAPAVAALQQQLDEAGRRARAERAPRLGLDGVPDVDVAVRARSRDWAQTRPEWGLAGCRAFVAAPRHRTRGVDLAGQVFLHEYDWHRDEGFAVLEAILTAPVVVASWINLQYHASTVDNLRFGSGEKTLHNVVGRLGVVEGTEGDLRTGLPLQSVHDGTRPQHEPVRLQVVVEAPTDAVTAVLERHTGIRELVTNDWVRLLVMDDDGVVAARCTADLAWEPLG